VLTQVCLHHFDDEEIRRTTFSAGRPVLAAEVLFEFCLSAFNVIRAAASAELFLSVDNDPIGLAIGSCFAQYESGW
jgi:hypothetical protein